MCSSDLQNANDLMLCKSRSFHNKIDHLNIIIIRLTRPNGLVYSNFKWPTFREAYIRHKYRAKNVYGGLIIKEQVFYLNKQGVVINVVDF